MERDVTGRPGRANTGCAVTGCSRSHHSDSVCRNHYYHLLSYRSSHEADISASAWIEKTEPAPYDRRPECVIESCSSDGCSARGLCTTHQSTFTAAQLRRDRSNRARQSVAEWAKLTFEPPFQADPLITYATLTATPFFMLPEPLQSEWLYAIQQRDLHGRARISPVEIRGFFKDLLESEIETAVGLDGLGLPPGHSNTIAMIAEWQQHIDDAHRQWSGVENRTPDVVYLGDLEHDPNHLAQPGPRAQIDLSGFVHEWLKESLRTWAFAAPRHPEYVRNAHSAMLLMDEVLAARRTPVAALGQRDMDAVVRALRERWPATKGHGAKLTIIERIISFSRTEETLAPLWADVPPAFFVNRMRHRARRKKRALESIPPRRLNAMGQAVAIDRERDSYTKVSVTLGHCTEPHNVKRGGDGCVLDHACESCPFFLVDPLERDGLTAKRDHMRIRLERARVINSPSHILDHYVARIADCNRIIAGIDAYVADLPDLERERIEAALNAMADVRRRAMAARTIDIRPLLLIAEAS